MDSDSDYEPRVPRWKLCLIFLLVSSSLSFGIFLVAMILRQVAEVGDPTLLLAVHSSCVAVYVVVAVIEVFLVCKLVWPDHSHLPRPIREVWDELRLRRDNWNARRTMEEEEERRGLLAPRAQANLVSSLA